MAEVVKQRQFRQNKIKGRGRMGVKRSESEEGNRETVLNEMNV